MKRFFILSIFCVCCLMPKGAEAVEIASPLEMQVRDLAQKVSELTLLVQEQQKEIRILKETREVEPVPVTQVSSASRTLQGRWNPDIGALADTVLLLDSPKEDVEGADRISVRELELILGSPVDPYSRLDATIAFSDFEAASLEEAYYTHFDILGWGITGRLGRFKPYIGKAASLHRDSLDTVDEPLVVQRYFGLEGFNKSGADISRDIDFPWPVAHRLTLGVLEGGNGEEGTLFGETRRRPTLYAHLKNYLDLSQTTGLEFGITDLAGSRDADSAFEVNVLGLDATLIHRYADQRHMKLQAETYRVSRAESFYSLEDSDTGEITGQDLDDARNLWGGYVLADWRFHPQWAAGFRWDNVQLIETAEDFANPESTERGYTGYLTFYQSEFARWRLQVSHIDLTNADDDNRIFVQGTFAIGEHKHKLQ